MLRCSPLPTLLFVSLCLTCILLMCLFRIFLCAILPTPHPSSQLVPPYLRLRQSEGGRRDAREATMDMLHHVRKQQEGGELKSPDLFGGGVEWMYEVDAATGQRRRSLRGSTLGSCSLTNCRSGSFHLPGMAQNAVSVGTPGSAHLLLAPNPRLGSRAARMNTTSPRTMGYDSDSSHSSSLDGGSKRGTPRGGRAPRDRFHTTISSADDAMSGSIDSRTINLVDLPEADKPVAPPQLPHSVPSASQLLDILSTTGSSILPPASRPRVADKVADDTPPTTDTPSTTGKVTTSSQPDVQASPAAPVPAVLEGGLPKATAALVRSPDTKEKKDDAAPAPVLPAPSMRQKNAKGAPGRAATKMHPSASVTFSEASEHIMADSSDKGSLGQSLPVSVAAQHAAAVGLPPPQVAAAEAPAEARQVGTSQDRDTDPDATSTRDTDALPQRPMQLFDLPAGRKTLFSTLGGWMKWLRSSSTERVNDPENPKQNGASDTADEPTRNVFAYAAAGHIVLGLATVGSVVLITQL